MKRIRLNCDMGEGMGNEAHIMPFIHSCNIACGGHAGNQQTMQGTMRLALSHRVLVGAHPSFEDRPNFGRVAQDWDRLRFRESITKQLQHFKEAALMVGCELNHIKMHGALYHATAHQENYAEWFVEWAQEYVPGTPIYGLPNSLLESKCLEVDHDFWPEAFADRAYLNNGSLVPRNQEGAVLTEVYQVVDQLEQLANDQSVLTITGKIIPIRATTYCIHGDNLKLINDLDELRKKLISKGVKIGA